MKLQNTMKTPQILFETEVLDRISKYM